MTQRPALFNLPSRIPSIVQHPLQRGHAVRRLRIQDELDRRKLLQQAREHVRRFVVRELLSWADSRSGVEGEEDERAGRDVLLDALVQKPVWVVRGGVWTPEVGAAVHEEDGVHDALAGGDVVRFAAWGAVGDGGAVPGGAGVEWTVTMLKCQQSKLFLFGRDIGTYTAGNNLSVSV